MKNLLPTVYYAFTYFFSDRIHIKHSHNGYTIPLHCSTLMARRCIWAVVLPLVCWTLVTFRSVSSLFFPLLRETERLQGAGIGEMPSFWWDKALVKSFCYRSRQLLLRMLCVHFKIVTFPLPLAETLDDFFVAVGVLCCENLVWFLEVKPMEVLAFCLRLQTPTLVLVPIQIPATCPNYFLNIPTNLWFQQIQLQKSWS